MKCPTCGLADLAHDTRDLTATYQGQALTIPQVEADWCSACGESITGPEESRRVMAAMAEARRQAEQAG